MTTRARVPGALRKNPFEHTLSVSLELSNLCQYAWFHEKCPLHLEMESPFVVREPEILPAGIVYRVLDTLARHSYGNAITFHQYSEPLLDPRLFEFIRHARRSCPKSEIVILTNGHYLTAVLASELLEAGVTQIIITLYGTQSERERKRKWVEREFPDGDACRCAVRLELDDRLTIYDREPTGSHAPCGAPLGSLGITRKAEVSLCCYDWRREHNFGSLHDRSLEDILGSQRVRETYERLCQGDRFLNICRRCGYSWRGLGEEC